MVKPDFFFVGAPKCGTSLMDHLLKRHPDLFLPLKELHYFGSDLEFNNPERSLRSYLDFFKDVPEGRRAGENSAWYLYSKKAAQEIKAFCPHARVVIMLRDPVSMMHSLHAHLLFTGNEDIEDFEEALAAEPDRKAGRRIPRYSLPRGALLYREVASFSGQVQRYYEAFGRERVRVILADDFRKDVQGVFRETLRFLGVRDEWPGMEDAFNTTKRSRNEGKRARSRAVVRFLKRPGNQAILRDLVDEPFPGYRRFLTAVRRLNIRFEERKPMSPELRARLKTELAPEVDRLAALIGRDLSGWKKV